MNIVTGYRGVPHITANAQQAFNQGIFGSGNCILNVGNKFSANLTDANTVTISDGEGTLQGVHFRIEPGTVETVNISNGTSGYKRIDYICARYTKNAVTGIEDVSLVVVEGTPDATTPTAPTYNTGDILTGSSPVDFPMYEVDLNGLTPELIALFEVKQSIPEFEVKTCNLNGSYIDFGSIFYMIIGKFLIFSASFTPNQTPVGSVEIEDNIGNFDGDVPFVVSAGGASNNDTTNRLAWGLSLEHKFKIAGTYSSGTPYYFGGVALLR